MSKPSSTSAIVHHVTDSGDTHAVLSFSPISVGIAGSMGMMPGYHTESAQANPRISRVQSVYGTKENALKMARLYGVREAFFRDNDKDGSVFNRFLETHQFSVIAGPNNVHVPQAVAAMKVPYKGPHVRSDRFIYLEKPPAHSLEDTVRLVDLESEHPGQIAVVAHNRLWDMLLEMRYLISTGAIGTITNVEVAYQQAYQKGEDAPGWRIQQGVVGEKGNTADGPLGKLIDIAYHAQDTLTFVTGLEVKAIGGANVHTVEPLRRIARGGAFGSAKSESQLVTVGGTSGFHNDDVLYANLLLGKKEMSEHDREALVSMRVTQTDAGHQNHLALRVYGARGSLWFSTDDPLNLYSSDGGIVTHATTYASPALKYRETLPDWLKEGLDMRGGAPFGYDTPPAHMTGWKEVHSRQLKSFALYGQLVSQGVIDVSERAKLYTVPTVAESLQTMHVLKTIYEAAASQQRTAVDYTRRE